VMTTFEAAGRPSTADGGLEVFPGASNGIGYWLGIRIVLEPSDVARDVELYVTEKIPAGTELRHTLYFIAGELEPYFEMR